MPRLSSLSTFSTRGSNGEMPLLATAQLYVGFPVMGGRYYGYVRPGSWAASNYAVSGGGISNQPIPSLILDGAFYDSVTGHFFIYFKGPNANAESWLQSNINQLNIGTLYNYSFAAIWGTVTTGSLSTVWTYVDTFNNPSLLTGSSYPFRLYEA